MGKTQGTDECANTDKLFAYPMPLPPDKPSVDHFTMDDANIYFTDIGTWQSSGYNNDGKIMKVPVGGGDVVTLAMGEIMPHHIAVDATNLYWTTDDAVRKMPLDGGDPITISSGSGAPQAIAVDAHYVYWTLSPAKLMRAAIDTDEVTELLDGTSTSIAFNGIALDNDYIYWTNHGELGTNTGSILKMPIGGGMATTLATGQSEPSRIAVDTTNIYWVNSGDFNTNVGLMKVALDGGVPVTIISTQSSTYAQYATFVGVFVDAENLYWASRGTQKYDHYDGAILKMPLAGGTATTLVSDVHFAQESIVARGCHVYFAANGGLNRIAAQN